MINLKKKTIQWGLVVIACLLFAWTFDGCFSSPVQVAQEDVFTIEDTYDDEYLSDTMTIDDFDEFASSKQYYARTFVEYKLKEEGYNIDIDSLFNSNKDLLPWCSNVIIIRLSDLLNQGMSKKDMLGTLWQEITIDIAHANKPDKFIQITKTSN